MTLTVSDQVKLECHLEFLSSRLEKLKFGLCLTLRGLGAALRQQQAPRKTRGGGCTVLRRLGALQPLRQAQVGRQRRCKNGHVLMPQRPCFGAGGCQQ